MKKLVLFLLKAVPVVGALCCALNSLLSYFGYDLVWTGYLFYVVLLLAWLALARYFRFCSFFFFLIYYILTAECVNIIDYLVGIPISDKGIFVLHCGIIGLTIILFTYCHVRETKKIKRHLKKLR